jgi:hypothetical protein
MFSVMVTNHIRIQTSEYRMDDRFLYVGVAHEGIKEAPNWGVRHSYKLYKDRKNQS